MKLKLTFSFRNCFGVLGKMSSCDQTSIGLFCQADLKGNEILINKLSSNFSVFPTKLTLHFFFFSPIFSSLGLTVRLAVFYGGTTWITSHLMQCSNWWCSEQLRTSRILPSAHCSSKIRYLIAAALCLESRVSGKCLYLAGCKYE